VVGGSLVVLHQDLLGGHIPEYASRGTCVVLSHERGQVARSQAYRLMGGAIARCRLAHAERRNSVDDLAHRIYARPMTGKAPDGHSTLLFIVGPPAVGKMSVGFEIAALTGLRLFHNHLAIEPVLRFYLRLRLATVQSAGRRISPAPVRGGRRKRSSRPDLHVCLGVRSA
jgi:hypothetical protein